jgi:geranylgeranyl pyrophosphate synthase
MNDPVLAAAEPSSIEQLLTAYFSTASLSHRLGSPSVELCEQLWQRALREPALEIVQRPSKLLRTALLAHCYELAGGGGQCPDEYGALVEILHAGSLIIDDIEDASSSRRGGPALHLMHGVPVALNAANWMYFWGLSLIEDLPLSAAAQLALHRQAVRTLLRCHHGQCLDLTANVYALSQADVASVTRATAELKTGALLELAAVLGAAAAGTPAQETEDFARFGREIGIALQMLDDLGGITSMQRCHKGHEDLVLGRPTWPWAWLSSGLSPDSYAELQALGSRVAARDLHPELLARRLRAHLRGSGRVRVRHHVQGACAQLEGVTGPAPAFKALRAELERMEKSYV